MKSGHQGNLRESEAVRCRLLVRRLGRRRRRMSLVLAGKRTLGEFLSVLSEGGLALVGGERVGAGLAMVSVAKVEDEVLVV